MNQAIYSQQWDVESFTDPGKKPYKVSLRINGQWECSCPAWTRHMSPGASMAPGDFPRTDCKHIDMIRGFWEQNVRTTVMPAPQSKPAPGITTPPVPVLASNPVVDRIDDAIDEVRKRTAVTTAPEPEEASIQIGKYLIRRRPLTDLDDTMNVMPTQRRSGISI